MIPAITFVDAVALVISHLNDELSDVAVSKRVPNPRPSEFVTVERTGGPRSGYVVDEAQVTLSCWADWDDDCADLTTDVRAAVNSMQGVVIDGTQVYRVTELSGPSDTPDPVSAMPRMRWSVVVQTRGAITGS